MKVGEARFVTAAVNPKHYPPGDRPEIAFAGRSNVGKSTLINGLLGGRKIAKVSQTPGKTRTINFFDIDGRFYLVDLPGYGFAKVAQTERQSWAPMVEAYLKQRPTLRCLLVLVDLRRGLGEIDWQLVEFLKANGTPFLVVFTKADKLKGNARRNQIEAVRRETGLAPEEMLVTAAAKGEGIEALWTWLEPLIAS